MSDLEKMKQEAQECDGCGLKETRRKVVFGEGNPRASFFFLGEAPGGKEDETGLPFVGEAGLNLTRCLDKLGLTREEIYLTSPVKCRPTKPSPRPRYGQYANRRPTAKEIDACRRWLEGQLDMVRPEMIVTLGDVPLKVIMGNDFRVGQCHGRILQSGRYGCFVFPLYHPAAVIYDRKKVDEMEADLTELKKEIEILRYGK